jgi:predicted secreted protein
MLSPFLNVAIFVIWWWIALFVMLPIGVKTTDPSEAGRGHDPGAPQAPEIWKKALWATFAAAILWAITAFGVWLDPFHIRD